MRLNVIKGKYYYEYLEETGFYHIFYTESDISPQSYASKEEAQFNVEQLNMRIRINQEFNKFSSSLTLKID